MDTPEGFSDATANHGTCANCPASCGIVRHFNFYTPVSLYHQACWIVANVPHCIPVQIDGFVIGPYQFQCQLVMLMMKGSFPMSGKTTPTSEQICPMSMTPCQISWDARSTCSPVPHVTSGSLQRKFWNQLGRLLLLQWRTSNNLNLCIKTDIHVSSFGPEQSHQNEQFNNNNDNITLPFVFTHTFQDTNG